MSSGSLDGDTRCGSVLDGCLPADTPVVFACALDRSCGHFKYMRSIRWSLHKANRGNVWILSALNLYCFVDHFNVL